MQLSTLYTRELKDNFNYVATWLPNVHLALGDVGVLEDNEFKYRTTLQYLGIPFTTTQKGAPARYSHSSANRVKRSLKLQGAAPVAGSLLAQADAGISFTFDGESAIFFEADECTVRMIADQLPLKSAILAAYGNGVWEKDFVVVSEVVEAATTTVIVAHGSGASIDLLAKAGVTPSFSDINVDGAFKVANENQIGFNCVAKSGMTPLFRALGVKKGILRDTVANRATFDRPASGVPDTAGARDTLPDAATAVVDVDYDDYTASVSSTEA